MSRGEIAITTGFTGDEIVVFGTTDRSIGAGADEILVLAIGPTQGMVVRRKTRVLGFWINGAAARFPGVPSYYAVTGTRPLRDLLGEGDRRELQLGIDALPLWSAGPQGVGYRAALRELKQEAGEWIEDVSPITVAAGHLFQARIPIPATVLTGDYLVEVMLVRNRRVVARQALSLRVDREGTAARIADVAERAPLVYGLVCVLLAALAGWFGSVLFRRG
nr:TIGR02186 family protein [Roseomonas acroporae]